MEVRNHRFDILSSVAICMVTIIHSATAYTSTGFERWAGGWLDLFSRPCIAIFLFSSGYFFFTDKLTKEKLLKRIVRVMVPYTVAYLAVCVYENNLGLFYAMVHRPLSFFGNYLIASNWGIYYFVFVIFYAYLAGYIVYQLSPLRTRMLAVTVIFFFGNLLQGAFYDPLNNQSKIALIYYYRSPITWLCFFFLGWLYRQYDIQRIIDSQRITVRGIWLAVYLEL